MEIFRQLDQSETRMSGIPRRWFCEPPVCLTRRYIDCLYIDMCEALGQWSTRFGPSYTLPTDLPFSAAPVLWGGPRLLPLLHLLCLDLGPQVLAHGYIPTGTVPVERTLAWWQQRRGELSQFRRRRTSVSPILSLLKSYYTTVSFINSTHSCFPGRWLVQVAASQCCCSNVCWWRVSWQAAATMGADNCHHDDGESVSWQWRGGGELRSLLVLENKF
jgi:hypothetical protein